MDVPAQEDILKPNELGLSIIIPTYNESHNIARILDSVSSCLPVDMTAQIIVVDDNSPDRTGDIAVTHAKGAHNNKIQIEVIRRPAKLGLSSAILAGVRFASGELVVVMDGDFSHPPETIPDMISELQTSECNVVIASRYIAGGSITGWPVRRKLMSRGATNIARYGLGVDVKDPMSGFFAFKRRIIKDVSFDAIGYKMLLEILVKAKDVTVSEIPYAFTNRTAGSSKINALVVYDYLRAVYRLYRHGKSSVSAERRTSVRFFSKAGRFYSVGATGLLVNYASSILLGTLFPSLWYLYGTIMGIVLSITSNFFLNKIWTFEDRDFRWRKTAVQYGMFSGFSSPGALLQLAIVYILFEGNYSDYPLALLFGVAIASIGNFLLNKKWTFRERIWS